MTSATQDGREARTIAATDRDVPMPDRKLEAGTGSGATESVACAGSADA